MTRLFEAYFRVAGHDRLLEVALPLDLPDDQQNRYAFRARFTKASGWTVEAELKREHIKLR